MIPNEIREKLQDIVRGTCFQGTTDCCSKIRNILIESFGAGPTVKSEFESRAIIKENQAAFLKTQAEEFHIWLECLPAGCKYLTKGGESKVFLASSGFDVIKINDAIYYATWMEYFNNLVIHNLLFPNTAYTLIGFTETEGNLHAVLKQPFIEGQQARLEDIKDFLSYNGFENVKRQDYYNEEFSLVLEDMHDENVIAKDDILFFIDTVFYIMEK
ncbi:MAG TPA: hypothetical protein VGB84_01560 [Arachidicoccus sp.]